MAFYQLNKPLERKQRILFEVGGFVLILLVWYLITLGSSPLFNPGILPSPGKVLAAFFEMLNENDLVTNFFYSLGLNLGGYMEAVAIAVPFGFALGLIPKLRSTFIRPVNAVRFLVLPAAVGLFITWFGIGSWMKIHFLAFGIIIYLLPVAIQRIDEVNDVYLKTVYTLGAKPWQTIRTVYFPAVISRLFSDIRILTAISWTYIVIAEAIGGEAGIGALTWRVGLRRGRMDKVFCLIIIIMLVGILQDKLFGYLDKKLFPHKYISPKKHSVRDEEVLIKTTGAFIKKALAWIILLVYLLLVMDDYFGVLGNYQTLSVLFRDTIWVIHIIFFLFGCYMILPHLRKWQSPKSRKKSDG